MDRKQQEIVSMFDTIAKRYDLANRVLSFGTDIRWRKIACQKALELYGKERLECISDIACGTGDMLGFWEQESQKRGVEVEKFLGIDPSKKMLEVAKEKFPHIAYKEAYAQDLPLEDESSDIVSITYGIRNVTERKLPLKSFGEF